MSAEPPTPPDPTAYGQPISAERQAALQAILDAWNAPGTDHGGRKGPFDRTGLSVDELARLWLKGADVGWLAERGGREVLGGLLNLHLKGAVLNLAHLEGANLGAAHLEGADLIGAHLERADLSGAYLEGADLGAAHLQHADLSGAHLESADFSETHLEGANLRAAHLEGANLDGAKLEGADLGRAWLDSKTILNDAVLDAKTQLGDIQWGGVGAVNLTQLNWDAGPRLGDETALTRRADAEDIEGVVRAYRQVAAQLRAEGMSEVADRFSERAQVVQRRGLRKRRRYSQWFFSWRSLPAMATVRAAPSRGT